MFNFLIFIKKSPFYNSKFNNYSNYFKKISINTLNVNFYFFKYFYFFKAKMKKSFHFMAYLRYFIFKKNFILSIDNSNRILGRFLNIYKFPHIITK